MNIFGPIFIVGALFEKANEVHDVKRCEQKNIQNKSSTNKIKFIYQEIHEKETLQIF